MDDKERNFYDKIKDAVSAYVLHDPNAQAAAAFDREKRMKSVDDKTLSMFRESAEAGHPFSCFNLGRCYETGSGVEKDLEQAYEWYRKAAAGGDVNAWLALAKMFDTGTYVGRDPKEAAMWLSRAANKEHPIAMIGMGQKYTRGDGVERDHEKALELFKEARKLAPGIGSYVLGEAIGDGIGCKKDYAEAVKLFEEAHEHKFPLGTYNLGMMLEMGLGCEKDEKKGFELIKQAADEGVAEAMYRIAFHYREGTSEAQKDDKTAFEYFKKAADKGFAPAQVETGLSYENGVGVEMNKEEAFKYYEKGAEAGLHTAIVCLGVCYRSGIGCEPDEEKALELMEDAVALGNTRAYHLMASFLFEEDPYDERAMNLEMVAARAGFARSSMFLGGFFVQRSDMGPDMERAEHYFRLAAREGDGTAMFELAEILDTEENKDNEKIQRELRALYAASADSGHPLAAYKMAQKYKDPASCKTAAEAEQKEIHYMCIAASGGIPDAAKQIAERSFWGDKMRVSIPSACALYRLAAEDLGDSGLMAKYAFTRLLVLGEWLYRQTGFINKTMLPAAEAERKKLRENKDFVEAVLTLNNLAAENVPEARMFRPLVKALFFGSDLSSEEDKSDLAFIEEQPDCRQKRYVNGLIAAVIHQEQPKEAIDILSDARENHGVGNVNYLLGNLYETLARSPRKMKKTEVPVASGSGKKWTWVKKKKNTKEEYLRSASFYYLQAFSNGETKSPAMYDYAADQLLADAKQRSLLAMGIVLLVSIPVLFLLFMMDHEGAMTAKEKWDLLFKIIGINMAVYLGLFLLMELISVVKKLNMKKRSGKMKKEMK
ncbi:MAG: sel1 repeat family protein [Clostridiales bacterium]|nr:sel1 repeat family protein [Clostridiales bacterium]